MRTGRVKRDGDRFSSVGFRIRVMRHESWALDVCGMGGKEGKSGTSG